jgi:3-phenylpropionate/cinnamic acid dioxygenase small subunit
MMWLTDEAELLDRRALDAWLGLLAPDVRYVMPARATVHRADGLGVFSSNHHFDETLATLTTRVRRLSEATNYAEDPPSRTRRFVTNIRVFDAGPDGIAASSYLLLLRSRGDSPSFEMLSCGRDDLLRRCEDGLKLARRDITIDQSTLGMVHLGVLL